MLIYEIIEAAIENPDIKVKCPSGKIIEVLDPYFEFFKSPTLDGFITKEQLIQIFGVRAEYEIVKGGGSDETD